MRREFRFTVSGDPEPKGSTRAFVVRSKADPEKYRAVTTSDNPKLKRWEKLVATEAMIARAKAGNRNLLGQELVFGGPVAVEIRFYLDRPASVKRPLPTVRPDLDKLVRATIDPLTGVLFLDDAQVVQIAASKVYNVREPFPYAEVVVSEVTEV